ncbi:hypothetical protein [Paenibacillus sp. y28]|uniref:hypothetical protein n=1 Tax=Paenibacillus sp. y28 TaxID=3129110 RepID=UPI0030175526
MKQKSLFVITLITLTLVAVYLVADHYYVKEVEASHADYKVYNSVEELAQDVPLIVEVTATPNTKEFKNENSEYLEGYALTEVIINKVHKDDYHKIKTEDRLPVIERFFTMENGVLPGKTRYLVENYTGLQAKSKYLLFLTWSEERQGYWIQAVHQGKINIDGQDKKEQAVESHEPRFQELKKSVVQKFAEKQK